MAGTHKSKVAEVCLDSRVKDDDEVLEICDLSKVTDSGNESKVTDIGDESKVRDIGDESKITDFGDESRVTGIGDESKVTESDDESKVTDIGDESIVTDVGDESKATDVGDESKVTDVGDESRVTEGNNESKLTNDTIGASDDSEWEDQDTSEDENADKLTIDEQDASILQDGEKDSKDDRSKIPENILRECRKFISLDKKLDRKARKNNMTSKQVKLVLKHIFSSEQIIAMLRDKGLLTTSSKQEEELEAAEPKMTRSVTRTLTEAGDICPWIINPKTPVKEPPPEIVSLVTEEFPDEEEEDPEYTPEIEPRQSEDDDSMMETSEAGTPNTNLSRSTINTPRSEQESPAAFKMPGLGASAVTPRGSYYHSSPRSKVVSRNLQFDNTEPSWEGYGTRSKRPLTELNIGDLEKQLPPLDITPDMYDFPIPDDPYSEFLKTFLDDNLPSMTDNCTQDDDQADPEYSFPADEEEHRLKDPEELRHDRATKVSRKELMDLIAELQDCGNEANRSERESPKKAKIKKKRAVNLHEPPVNLPDGQDAFNIPSASSTQNEIDHSEQTSFGRHDQNELKDEQTSQKQEEEMSPEAYYQLSSQIQQHIQQITHMRLICTNSPHLDKVTAECDQMLQDLQDKSSINPSSVMNQCNLLSSVDVIKRWSMKNLPSTQFKKRKETTRKYPAKVSISKKLVEFMLNEPIILYPELVTLRQINLSPCKTVWTKSEDMLIAQGLEWINLQNAPNGGGEERKKFLSKISLVDLAQTLSIKRLPAKSADQIYIRMKNLRKEHTVDARESIGLNPVLQYFNSRTLPKVYPVSSLPRSYPARTIKDLVLSGNRDLPNVYVDCALKHWRPSSSSLRMRKVTSKELVEVTPDIPTDSDELSSDSEYIVSAHTKRRRTTHHTKNVITKKSPVNSDSDDNESVETKRRTQYILPKVSPVKTKPRYRPLLPNQNVVATVTHILPDTYQNAGTCSSSQPQGSSLATATNMMLKSSSCRVEMAATSSTQLSQLSGFRHVLCVDGNETPVSLSESETPVSVSQSETQSALAASQSESETPGALLSRDGGSEAPSTSGPPVTQTGDESEPEMPTLSTVPSSLVPSSLTKPVFRSPEKSRILSSSSPSKSPFKSPLKSLNNTYHRSPLKAASDRIIRKYTSPLKRKRSRGSPITPKRLLMLNEDDDRVVVVKSPRTPTSSLHQGGSLTSPQSGGGGADADLDTPTGLARRKSRVQREAQVTALLLADETDEERVAREQRESQELFVALRGAVNDNLELEPRYEKIIDDAHEKGVRETYLQLHDLMRDHENVQEHLLDLLAEEDALALGMQVYSAFSERKRQKMFLRKLNIAYKQQPAYVVKVLKELETLSKDPELTSNKLQEFSSQMFRNNQHLIEEFHMLIPGIPPPQSMLPSPEILVLPEHEDEPGDEGGPVEDEHNVEQIFVPRSPDGQTESSSGNVRFSGGRCYVMDGKMLKPASIDRFK